MTGHLVLVGPMGSGKSVVGARLAKLTGRDFVDLDRELVERYGSIDRQFASVGETEFRAREERLLAQRLHRAEPCVLATGGGVVLSAANRRALVGQRVIWLRISPQTAARRLAGDTSRPLLAGNDPAAAWVRIAEQREPLYAEVATVAIDADHETPSALARSLADAMNLSTVPQEQA